MSATPKSTHRWLPDLFNPTNEPKDLAINQAIKQAVEEWVVDDMDGAEHMLDMAKEFLYADPNHFNP
jgi:hypothetical protein